MAATIRILYVDDEPSLLDIGKMFLEKGGALTVDTLTSAIEALEQLKTKRYDAILSDYQMPDMDGITFLKQLKVSGNKTPFIIFTGRGREEVVIEALNSGADFYIQKGGDPKSQFAELSHKIKTAVSRQKTEKLAKDTERRLYDIINFLPDATFAIDTDGTVIAWNKAIEEMTGVPASEMLGRGNYEYAIPFYDERRPILINLVSIPDNELAQGKYAVIKKEGNILIAETTLPRPLGRYSVLLGKASLLYNDEGTAIGAIESIRDITEQKKVEASLMEQEEQSRMLLSSMPDIVMVHHDGIIVFANQMAIEKTGYSEEELIGSHIFNYVKETDREIIIKNMGKRACGELVGDYEIDMIHKSGLMHHVIIRTSPIVFNQLPSIVFIIIDITERKRAEEALRESEEKYRLIFDNSPLGHLSFDEKGVIVTCNDKFIQIIGSSRDALIGLNMLSLPDKNLVSAVQKALDGSNGLYEGVYSSVTAKKITPVKGIFAPINFRDGRIPGGMGIFEDITERQHAELALQESEEKYRDIFENSVMGLFKTAPDGQMINANNALARMYGYLSAEKILNAGINVGQLYANIDDRKEVLHILSEKGKIENYETQHLKQDGTRFWVSITARTICNSDGSVLFYEGTNLDITDRKEADEFIRLLARISDDAPASITVHDKEGNFLYANEKTLQLHGYTSEEFLKKNLHEIDVPESEQLIVKRMQQIQETGAADFDVQHFRKDGSLLPLHLNVKTVVWDKKKVLLSIATDLTERKNAEVLLKESELKYRSLIESSSDAIFCVDKNGEYKFTNLVFASTFDKTPEYFIGKTFWDIYPKEQADHRQLTNLKLFETGVTQTIEVEVPLPETTLYFIAKANPIKDETGKVILNLTHATDITERKRAERAIQQANQKLLLLSSITRHDINNQLTVLQGYLELVVMKQEDHNLIDYCQKAITAAQRIYAMIRFTKEYESLGISAPTWHDTRTLIETTAKQAPLGKVIVKNDIPSGNEIFADPLIIKVCYNLMDNAVQYGKKITTIRFSVLKRNDEHLIICEDDGGGVLAEEKEKIFERGFGKNTGLGLALSREILSITGITIRETGEPGKGARFEMTVPKVMWRMTMREN